MTFTEPPTDPQAPDPGIGDSGDYVAGAQGADDANHQPTDANATPPPPGPQVRRLYRDPSGPAAGVATGFANYFGIDPVVAQIAFVALTVFGGSGILLYLAAWMLVPKSEAAGSAVGLQRRGLFSVAIGALLLVGAAGSLLAGLGFGFGGPSTLFWLFLIGGGAFLLTQRSDEVDSVGESVRDLLRPRDGWAVPAPTQAAPQQTHRAFAPQLVAPAAAEPRPPITSITLGLTAVVVGILSVVNQFSGASIGSRTYFGVVVLFCGIGVVVSSVRGRAWGLIAVGLITASMLPVAPAFDYLVEGGFGERYHRIRVQEDLDQEFNLAAGEQTLDLVGLILDEDATLEVATSLGATLILVPEEMQVVVNASADAGSLKVFGHNRDGTRLTLHNVHPGHSADASHDAVSLPQLDPDKPTLTIEADSTFGEVVIRHDR